MGRQLTMSRPAEGAAIDVMVWLLEPEVRLVETRSFATLAELASWLRNAPDVSVDWTDELKADPGLALAVAEVLGTAPADPRLPSVHSGAALFPGAGAHPPEAESARPAFADHAASVPRPGNTRPTGRPRARRHQRPPGRS